MNAALQFVELVLFIFSKTALPSPLYNDFVINVIFDSAIHAFNVIVDVAGKYLLYLTSLY